MRFRRASLRVTLPPLLTTLCALFFGCAPVESKSPPSASAPLAGHSPASAQPILLGIDVLESQQFAPLRGKRVGLLTHPAGVNRQGISTIDVLRRAPGVNLVALFGPEHGIYGRVAAGEPVYSSTDPRTGLPVHSLFQAFRKPGPEMLRGIDVFVIDLQDIGVRSYTYVSSMRYSMEACFEQNIEVMVLDRPNPLGGLKVSGPPMDRDWMSFVGAFRVPYVHGLTIGELARMAKEAPGVLAVEDSIRQRGKLTVVPMRGWQRSMRWPETGLRFVPTSPRIPDFAAVVGYAMIGLGCEYSGFSHGIGTHHFFRTLALNGVALDRVEASLAAAALPGLRFRRITAAGTDGKPRSALYAEVVDWNAWQPADLSFHLMRMACQLRGRNPFTTLSDGEVRLFNIHVGSTAWWDALTRDGAQVDVESFLASWKAQARVYQEQSRRFWLYR